MNKVIIVKLIGTPNFQKKSGPDFRLSVLMEMGYNTLSYLLWWRSVESLNKSPGATSSSFSKFWTQSNNSYFDNTKGDDLTIRNKI